MNQTVILTVCEIQIRPVDLFSVHSIHNRHKTYIFTTPIHLNPSESLLISYSNLQVIHLVVSSLQFSRLKLCMQLLSSIK